MSSDDTERPPGQVCPNPECHIDQRWKGFHGLCCPECAYRLVVACSKCDSGAVERVDGSPRCSEHVPELVADGGIDRATAEKERGLLEQDYATPCPKCGGVVFEWWGSDTCRDCEDSNDETTSEQTTLITDGGTERIARLSEATKCKHETEQDEGDTCNPDYTKISLTHLDISRTPGCSSGFLSTINCSDPRWVDSGNEAKHQQQHWNHVDHNRRYNQPFIKLRRKPPKESSYFHESFLRKSRPLASGTERSGGPDQ